MLDKDEAAKELTQEEAESQEVTEEITKEGIKEEETQITQPVEEKPEPAEKEDEPKTEEITEVIKVEKGYQSKFDGVDVEIELQFQDQGTDMKEVTEKVVADYTEKGNDAAEIKLIQVYLKPTDFTAYYVINNSYEGKVSLF